MTLPGHGEPPVRVTDIFAGEACIDEVPGLVHGSSGALSVREMRLPLAFTVRHAECGKAHLAFAANPAAQDGLLGLIGRPANAA